MKRKRSLKLQKFKKIYLETGNATEAAMQAYDCKDRNSARTLGTQCLAKLSFSELMEEAGITDKRLIEKVSDGMEAQKVISSYGGKNADASTTDFIEVPDHAVQHKYVETALKLKGRGQVNTTNNVQVNIMQKIQEQNEKYQD